MSPDVAVRGEQADLLLVVLLLLTAFIQVLVMAMPAPGAFHAVEAVSLLSRCAAAGWLLATRGRERHPRTYAVIIGVDVLMFVVSFALIQGVANAGIPLALMSRVPFVFAVLPRRQVQVLTSLILVGCDGVLLWQAAHGNLITIGLAVLFTAVVLVTGITVRVLTSSFAASARGARELAAQLEHAALHDPLTGLANRTLYTDRLEHAVAHAHRTGRDVAVLLVDLDHFKDVNDTHGHATGDALLAAVADRLRATVRAGDTVARLGGDEFVVVLDDIADPADALATARHLRDALIGPITADGVQLRCSASIGVAFARARGHELGKVLREADVAMYRAKAQGPGHLEVFDTTPDLPTALPRRAVDTS
ncbi:GGDEF domain-containing protein [Cellulomonas sp. NS3]|uniref:GGDEF domain-containing protein n=1 Tax=Cellulomonas sp. NS3 TaxID=2973977 RepID=UPI00216395A7|nr:GGDEF domain-containing protein [Cellulomonas sp. NS3]